MHISLLESVSGRQLEFFRCGRRKRKAQGVNGNALKIKNTSSNYFRFQK